MNSTDKPVPNPIVVLREDFDDLSVLYNPDTADAIGINPIGAAIWKQMDGRRTVSEIIAHLRASYADVPDTVTDEIIAFIDGLARKGFARV